MVWGVTLEAICEYSPLHLIFPNTVIMQSFPWWESLSAAAALSLQVQMKPFPSQGGPPVTEAGKQTARQLQATTLQWAFASQESRANCALYKPQCRSVCCTEPHCNSQQFSLPYLLLLHRARTNFFKNN